MEVKRIAMISYHTCPLATLEGGEIGGLNTYVLELSKQLSRLGIIVDIYTRAQRTNDIGIVKIRSNLRLIHLKAGPRRKVLKKNLIKYLPEFVKSYQKFTQKNNLSYNLYHCHYYLSGLSALEFSKNDKKPIVMSFHTLALMKNLVARDELEKEEVKRIDAEYILTKAADRIIAPSVSDSRYLQALYAVEKEKIKIIPPGVNLKLFRPINKNSAKLMASARHPIILFVGRTEPLKGLDMLLYAIRLLMMRNPKRDFRLWIVGGKVNKNPNLWSKHLKVILQLRQLLNLNKIVKFVGQKPQSKLPYYYNSAEMVVMPSHYESFGMVALEAMACKIPVITSNAAGVSLFLDQKFSSLITAVNNPLLLSYQIEKLLEDRSLAKEMAEKNFKLATSLNWEIIAQQVLKTYQETKE